MKKAFLSLALIFIGFALLGIVACEKENVKDEDPEPEKPKKEWTIHVYGRPTCGYCSALKSGLDAESIPYLFYDIDTDNEKKSEMWAKLNAAGMGGGSVGLPVVDVVVDNVSHMFIRPNIEEDIKPLIAEE